MSLLQGVIGNVLQKGGAQYVDYHEKEAAQRRLDELRAADTERQLRIEEIRARRQEEAQIRAETRAKDATLDAILPGGVIGGAKIEAEEAAATRQLERDTDPAAIELRTQAERLKARGAPVRTRAGERIDVYNEKTGRYETLIDNDNKTRGTSSSEKEKPAYTRLMKNIDRDEDDADKELAELRKERRDPANAADEAALERIAAAEKEALKRKAGAGVARYKADIQFGNITPEDDAASIAPGLKSSQELDAELAKMQKAGAPPAHVARVRQLILGSGAISPPPPPPPPPPPTAGTTGSEARASAAAGILSEPAAVPPPAPLPQALPPPNRSMSPFATGAAQMAAARPPGVIEAAAPVAPPPPPPAAVAAAPQVTGDPSTGLMPPSPQPSVAAAGVPQVGRVPGAAPGPWQEINNELAFKKNPTAADRITILTNELNRPGQTPENKRAIQYEIDAITKKNPGVIDQTRAEVNLMDPQQTSTLPGAAKVIPPTDPTVSTAVAPAQAKRILASNGGAIDNEQYEALRQKVLSKSAKATVTNTRSQELTVKRAEAAAITPSAVVEMTPAEAKQKLDRLLPVLTAEQYRALRMRARG